MTARNERIASIPAEQSLIASCIVDGTGAALDGAAASLQPRHFSLSKHQHVFRALLAMQERGQKPNSVLLVEQLERDGKLDDVGGVTAVAQVTEGEWVHDVGPLAEIVRELSWRRHVAAAALDAHRISLDPTAGADDVRTAVEVLKEEPEDREDPVCSFGAAAAQRVSELDRLADEPHSIAGLETGLESLDKSLLGGVRAGELMFVGGAPGFGKSSLLVMAALANARNGYAVAFFSAEMSKDAVTDRLLALECGIPLTRLRDPRLLTKEQRLLLKQTAQRLKDLPLYIDDTPAIAVETLRGRARLLVRRHDVALVLADYVQILSGAYGDSRRERIGDVGHQLKALAKETGTAVIAGSQIARPPRGSRELPSQSDLKESGDLEAVADCVVLLHRPFLTTRRPEDRDADQLIIGKQRHGPTGSLPVVFDAPFARFLPRSGRTAG